MTSRSTWKRAERQTAKFFGTERTPLSGGNSKITRSDTIHHKLFVENKYRKKCAVRTLYDKTVKMAEKEKKVPVLTLHAANRKGFLIVVHSDDLDYAIHVLRKARRESIFASETLGGLPELSAITDTDQRLSVPWDDPL